MTIRILVGDVRSRLADLPDGSVQCVVTSPPYFGLRDYGTAQWDGGDSLCQHRGRGRSVGNNAGVRGANASEAERKRWARNKPQLDGNQYEAVPYGGSCVLCGAVRVDQQIGLEPTLSAYVETLVAVFREVRRVLRPDGTCWLNLGDSYGGGNSGQTVRDSSGGVGGGNVRNTFEQPSSRANPGRNAAIGFKPKDLLMVPARVAIALQDDGWYLRSDIIWAKRNCMPESVTDRPTSSHEHIFLLTKQPRYYFDQEAVREISEYDGPPKPGLQAAITSNGGKTTMALGVGNSAGRNQRNVWTIATHPFPDAHFATFPTEIPRRCIKAGTSEKGQCAACGAPWVRVVERDQVIARRVDRQVPGRSGNGHSRGVDDLTSVTTTTGWSPSCSCDADVVPQTVLDPFLGSGTTLLVADQLGRNGIGVELSPEYAAMAENRIRGDAPMFVDIAAD